METKKDKEDILSSSIRREATPILKQFPKEELSNSMTTTKHTFKISWRPNNYRRQVEVKEKSNSTIKKIKSAISNRDLNISKHTKMISIKNYEGITIQYGRNTLTGIYSQNKVGGVKEIFLIEANTIDDLEERINQKKKEIELKIDAAINQFKKQFKINISYKKEKWARHEDFIKGEEYIDKIPEEVIIHDTYFKKVYGKGIEFKGGKGEEPTVKLKTYIKTRAIEDIAPEIANEINEVHKTISNELTPVLKEFSKQIRLHLEVQQDTLKTNNDMRLTLGEIRDNFKKESTKPEIKKRRKYGLSDEELKIIEEMEF